MGLAIGLITLILSRSQYLKDKLRCYHLDPSADSVPKNAMTVPSGFRDDFSWSYPLKCIDDPMTDRVSTYPLNGTGDPGWCLCVDLMGVATSIGSDLVAFPSAMPQKPWKVGAHNSTCIMTGQSTPKKSGPYKTLMSGGYVREGRLISHDQRYPPWS